jgi:hypothetical protein
MPCVRPIEALLLVGIAGAALDWALVMSLNTQIGVCHMIDLVSMCVPQESEGSFACMSV